MKLRSTIAAFHAALLAILLAVSPADAGSMTLLGAGKAGTAVAFSGMIDINGAALGCWGTRSCSAATKGSAVLNVCNSTGGVDVGCADMATDATTGSLVSATISGITCPGANCTVKTAYDQSGNTRDVTQATVASRPTLPASVIGSLSCMQFASAQTLTGGSLVSQAQPYQISHVSETTIGTTSILFGGGSGNSTFGYNQSGANTAFMASLTNFNKASVADSAFHSIQMLANSTSSEIYADGSSTIADAGVAVFNSGGGTLQIRLGGDFFGNTHTGFVCEVGLWSGNKSANDSSMNSNQHLYWGF